MRQSVPGKCGPDWPRGLLTVTGLLKDTMGWLLGGSFGGRIEMPGQLTPQPQPKPKRRRARSVTLVVETTVAACTDGMGTHWL